MRPAVRISLFVAAAAALFGLGYVAGSTYGGGREAGDDADAHARLPGEDNEAPGTSASSNGLRVELLEDELPVGTSELALRLRDEPSGALFTDVNVEHEQRMHLIVVSSDLEHFQHVHPQLGDDGVWRVDVTLPDAGTYRAYADFVPEARPGTVLAADVRAGSADARTPARIEQPHLHARVGAYTARLQPFDGHVYPGDPDEYEGRIRVQIERDGVPVTDLQPYLGALGHAVVVRADDLSYAHAHPVEPAGVRQDARGLSFDVHLRGGSGHVMFVEFRHGGAVHLARFELTDSLLARHAEEPLDDGHGHDDGRGHGSHGGDHQDDAHADDEHGPDDDSHAHERMPGELP